MNVTSRIAWENKAECISVDPDVFFPEGKTSMSRNNIDKLAKKVCDACIVQDECLAYALQNEQFGTWGGMTEAERKTLKRKRGFEHYS